MKIAIPIALVAGAVVLILALSGGGGTARTTAQAAGSATPKSTIAVRSTSLGKLLVDGQGRTLYLFEADKPGVSRCSGACLSLWPAVPAAQKPAAGAGVMAAKIGMTTTAGKPQATYNGHPLYLYAGDTKPGDTTGQDLNQFGAKWYVLAPSGDKIDNG